MNCSVQDILMLEIQNDTNIQTSMISVQDRLVHPHVSHSLTLVRRLLITPCSIPIQFGISKHLLPLHLLNGCFWFPYKVVGGIRWHIIPRLAVYTTYILPFGGLYATYHLLGNHWSTESTVQHGASQCSSQLRFKSTPLGFTRKHQSPCNTQLEVWPPWHNENWSDRSNMTGKRFEYHIQSSPWRRNWWRDSGPRYPRRSKIISQCKTCTYQLLSVVSCKGKYL